VGEQELNPGERPGYKEYQRSECLQMVGRAGRPQFDTQGVAVIMTQRDTMGSYHVLVNGQTVESCLKDNVAEFLNAELVLQTVKDVSQSIAWLKTTFMYVRIRKNPKHYG
jgi:ATP-dependent DNA helicase HFM1/MER3